MVVNLLLQTMIYILCLNKLAVYSSLITAGWQSCKSYNGFFSILSAALCYWGTESLTNESRSLTNLKVLLPVEGMIQEGRVSSLCTMFYTFLSYSHLLD